MDGSKPWHLGPVAAIAVIWFAIGAADYTMTQSRFGPYVAQFPEAQIAYYTALPALVDALWAIAVWGGLIGAVLLWNGSSKAAVVLAIPAVSMVLATTWFLVLSDPPMQAITGPAGLWIMLTSAAGSVVFWLYARMLHGRGQI